MVEKEQSPKELISTGSYGAVYKVNLDAGQFAVKELLRDNTAEYENELRVLKRLAHENIVNYVEQPKEYVHDRDDRFLIFMEFCEHGSLDSLMVNCELFYTVTTVSIWSRSIFNALLYLKTQNIVHCDIKPANLLITAQYILKVGDLGINREVGGTTQRAGTLAYMAPELRSLKSTEKEARSKRDIFAAGIVVWQLVERTNVPCQHFTDFPLPAEKTPACEIIKAARRCMEKDPMMRPEAQVMYDIFQGLDFGFDEDPFWRRGNTILYKVIGLDGSDIQSAVLGADGQQFEGHSLLISWSSHSTYGSAHVLQCRTSATIDAERESKWPLFSDWLEKSKTKPDFDDSILMCKKACADLKELFLGEEGDEIDAAFEMYPKAKLLFDGDNLHGKNISLWRLDEIDAFKQTFSGNDFTVYENDMKEPSWSIKDQMTMRQLDLAGGPLDWPRFNVVLFIEEKIRFACILFAVRVLAAANTNLFSTVEWRRVLNVAKKNVEELSKLTDRRRRYMLRMIEDSRDEWIDFDDYLVRRDWGEIRPKGSQNRTHCLPKTAYLDMESLRRMLVEKIRVTDHYEKYEIRASASSFGYWNRERRPFPQELDKLLLRSEPKPGYVFSSQIPPFVQYAPDFQVGSSDAPDSQYLRHDWPEWKCEEVKAVSLTDEERNYAQSHSCYERALRYISNWRLVSERPELQMLLRELLQEAKNMENALYPYFYFCVKLVDARIELVFLRPGKEYDERGRCMDENFAEMVEQIPSAEGSTTCSEGYGMDGSAILILPSFDAEDMYDEQDPPSGWEEELENSVPEHNPEMYCLTQLRFESLLPMLALMDAKQPNIEIFNRGASKERERRMPRLIRQFWEGQEIFQKERWTGRLKVIRLRPDGPGQGNGRFEVLKESDANDAQHLL